MPDSVTHLLRPSFLFGYPCYVSNGVDTVAHISDKSGRPYATLVLKQTSGTATPLVYRGHVWRVKEWSFVL